MKLKHDGSFDQNSAIEPVRPDSAALGSTITVSGEISGQEDLFVEGHIQGKITLSDHRLTIGRGAQVEGEVHVKEAVVLGRIKGNIFATGLVSIEKDASMDGDITAARIAISDGGQFKGSVRMRPSSPPIAAKK